VSPSSSPLVQRRRLRGELRVARQDAGLTQETVAEAMDWSLSKVIRIETGSVGVSTNDLHALLRLYGIDDAQRVNDLVAVGREARQQTWWSKYRGSVSPTYFQYIEYETAAVALRSHEIILIPGLLQTQEYATALAQRGRLVLAPKSMRTMVEIRMKRQEQVLGGKEPPLAFFILDEAVIRRLMGEKAVAAGQIARLLDLATQPRVTIEIVPFSAGLNRGMYENFSILEFGGPGDHDILYFESARDAIFSHDEAGEITTYRELFEELRGVSLGPEGTRDFLRERAEEIK
jgi:transcriptional regulator with XRE-family HTH domain